MPILPNLCGNLVAYMGGLVVAYIILYYTKPSGLYGRTQQRETAGSVQDWEER